jgi:hypothetical protein
MDAAGTTLVRCFVCEEDVIVDLEIETLGPGSFSGSEMLLSVEFESVSRLRRIETGAFSECENLEFISVPPSVEVIGESCFAECEALLSVEFEPVSKLKRIEARAFLRCGSLPSICIPASVESIGDESFSECDALSSFTFEAESKLLRIGARVFDKAITLKSIVIPRSIQELVQDWAMESSLCEVTFESAASLQAMIDADHVDLSGGFSIKIEDCDSDIDSLRSSIGHKFTNFAHLVDRE